MIVECSLNRLKKKNAVPHKYQAYVKGTLIYMLALIKETVGNLLNIYAFNLDLVQICPPAAKNLLLKEK